MSPKVAVSEIHSRLDYLVAYSSQLVFVANDDLQFQQNTLQSFIAQQHEDMEVAFLKGEKNRGAEDYRKEICRQILHKTTEQYDSSLRNVLQDFDGVENPILICLCAAHHLPQKLLEELWELVILARTLNNSFHVNIVLFGDPKWVVDAKKKLPSNNGNKPVLLSTELDNTVVKVAETQELSELDTLIANKRAAFAERVQDRTSVNNSKESKQSIIQTTKFKIAIGLVFLATFAALVWWFYPHQTKPITLESTEYSSQIKSENNTQVVLPVEIPEFKLNELDTIGIVETIESPENIDQLFVTQWDKSGSSESQESLEAVAEVLPVSTDSLSAKIPSPTVHSLENVQPGQFLIQISSTGILQSVEQFISDNSLVKKTWIYTTTRYGGPWHVIVYKKSFLSISEARSYIQTLSEHLKKSSPFVKSIEQIREEIALAN